MEQNFIDVPAKSQSQEVSAEKLDLHRKFQEEQRRENRLVKQPELSTSKETSKPPAESRGLQTPMEVSGFSWVSERFQNFQQGPGNSEDPRILLDP